MSPKTKMLAVIAAVVAAVGAIAYFTARSDNVPSAAIATVDGTALTKVDFDSALKVMSSGATGEKKTTATDQIVLRMIQGQWLLKEAALMGVKIDEPVVEAAFNTLKAKAFGSEAAYQKFLVTSGQTEAGLRNLVRAQVAQKLLLSRVIANLPITMAERRTYYNQHVYTFNRVNARDIRMIFTKNKRAAELAAAKLRSGGSWKTVALQYSEDSGTKSNAGKKPGVKKGDLENSVSKAIFSAQKNVVVGPIKSQFGYYVFQVDKVIKPKRTPLDEAIPKIDQILASGRDGRAAAKLQSQLVANWKDKTNCATGYIVSLCSNAAATSPKSAAPTGATGK